MSSSNLFSVIGRVASSSATRRFVLAATLAAPSLLVLFLRFRIPSPMQHSTNVPCGITASVAYCSTLLEMDDFDTSVPLAMWFPVTDSVNALSSGATDGTGELKSVKYDHRISVKKIAGMLAGLNFIPGFVSRNFQLSPSLPFGSVVDGTHIPFPSKAPVVLLAHGFLGSRFDLSHIGEALAQQGFVVISAEYPESMSASYPQVEGLDRSRINGAILKGLKLNSWGVQPTSYGIIGHSLGCATAMNIEGDSWTRVGIAGFPLRSDGSKVPGSVLFLASMNDGAVPLEKYGGKKIIPSDYVELDESQIPSRLPPRAALVFDRPDAPNHISFLAEGVNIDMLQALSPLLPIANLLGISVLDFDKYKKSQDSKQTAGIVVPLVSSFLNQYMKQ